MREELKKLEAINGEIFRKAALVDQIRDELEYLRDFRDAELLRNELRLQILQYSGRVKALENQRRDIIDSTSTLPEKQRKVLLLHYDCGMSWTDVSRAMGYSLRYIYRIAKG